MRMRIPPVLSDELSAVLFATAQKTIARRRIGAATLYDYLKTYNLIHGLLLVRNKGIARQLVEGDPKFDRRTVMDGTPGDEVRLLSLEREPSLLLARAGNHEEWLSNARQELRRHADRQQAIGPVYRDREVAVCALQVGARE